MAFNHNSVLKKTIFLNIVSHFSAPKGTPGRVLRAPPTDAWPPRAEKRDSTMSTAQTIQNHPVYQQATAKAKYYHSQLDKEVCRIFHDFLARAPIVVTAYRNGLGSLMTALCSSRNTPCSSISSNVLKCPRPSSWEAQWPLRVY